MPLVDSDGEDGGRPGAGGPVQVGIERYIGWQRRAEHGRDDDDDYLPRVRPAGRGVYARGRVRLPLAVSRLWCRSPSQAGGLLRVLQLRNCPVSTEAAVRGPLARTFRSATSPVRMVRRALRASTLSTQTFHTFLHDDGDHGKRCGRIGPPPAEQGIQRQLQRGLMTDR